MSRKTAIFVLVAILVGAWLIFKIPAAQQAFTSNEVLISFQETNVTLATIAWAITILVIYPCLIVAGYAIDPYLGYIIFRIGIEFIIVCVFKQKDFRLEQPERSGSGGSRSNRGS